jgi:hypothetical protein
MNACQWRTGAQGVHGRTPNCAVCEAPAAYVIRIYCCDRDAIVGGRICQEHAALVRSFDQLCENGNPVRVREIRSLAVTSA